MGDVSLGGLSVTLDAVLARFNSNMDAAGRKVDGVDAKISTLTKGAALMRAAFVVGGAAVVGVLSSMAAHALDVAEAIDQGTKAANIGTKEFTELAYAARTLNIDTAGLTDSLVDMNRAVSKAATGSEKEALAVAAIGTSVEELQKLNPAQRFERIADGISQLADDGDKARAAIALLGGNGQRLLPLLSQGAEGVRKLREEAVAMGQSFSEDQISKLAEAEDAVDRLKEAWDGFSVALTTKAAPALTAILDLLHGQLPKSSLESQIANVQYQISALEGTKVQRGLDKLEELRAKLIVLQNQANPVDDFASRRGRAQAGGGTAGGFQAAEAAKAAGDAAKKAAEAEKAERDKAAADLINDWYAVQNELANANREFFAAQGAAIDENFDKEMAARDATLQADQAYHAQRFELLATAVATEAELENQKYADQLALLDEFGNAELEALGGYVTAKEKLEADHMARLKTIREQGMTDIEKFHAMSLDRQVSTTAGQIVRMTAGVASGNKKLFELNKAAALAQAVVSLPAAIIESYKNAGGYPFGIAAAAAMAAAGAAQIAQIKSAKFGGGLAASQAGTGATPVAPARAAQTIAISGISPDAFFSGASVRKLLEMLQEGLNDGGKLVFDK